MTRFTTWRTDKRPLILATLAVLLIATPAAAKCYGWKCEEKAASKPSRQYITNTHRQIIGDLYDPGAGRRVQIRDKHRRIIGYIEADGTVTHTSRQRVGTVEGLAR